MNNYINAWTTGQLLWVIFTSEILVAFLVYGLVAWVRGGRTSRRCRR